MLALTHLTNVLQGPWVPYSTPLHLAAAKGDYLTTLALLSGWAQQAQQQGRNTGPDPRTVHDFWGEWGWWAAES